MHFNMLNNSIKKTSIAAASVAKTKRARNLPKPCDYSGSLQYNYIVFTAFYVYK